MHLVKCYYCGKSFDRDKFPFVKVNARRYAHPDCQKNQTEKQEKESDDKIQFENYVMKLFNEDYLNPLIQKQIKEYVEEYHYTYSGMLKALVYFYEIKGNSPEKAHQSLGIIPYIYQQAFNYYYSIWMINQQNEDKNIEDYIPKTNTVIIPVPKREKRSRNLFSFLNEEDT